MEASSARAAAEEVLSADEDEGEVPDAVTGAAEEVEGDPLTDEAEEDGDPRKDGRRRAERNVDDELFLRDFSLFDDDEEGDASGEFLFLCRFDRVTGAVEVDEEEAASAAGDAAVAGEVDAAVVAAAASSSFFAFAPLQLQTFISLFTLVQKRKKENKCNLTSCQ